MRLRVCVFVCVSSILNCIRSYSEKAKAAVLCMMKVLAFYGTFQPFLEVQKRSGVCLCAIRGITKKHHTEMIERDTLFDFRFQTYAIITCD